MLADSSVVTLALPEVVRELDAAVADVAWVLTSFNLVLAVAALPAVALVRRGGAETAWRAGLLVFAAASLACAVAPTLEVLVAARCVQALGGAAVVAAALELLARELDARRAVALWGGAGIIGAALGPALGGALTEWLSWEAIFAAQVPLVLVAAAPLRRSAGTDRGWSVGDAPPPAVALALALISAALTAALFLLVVMLIEGWRLSPAGAAAAVSIMPVAALMAAPLGRCIDGRRLRAAVGAVGVAGGLAALGLLPGSNVAWTVAPQVLVGAGLGIALAALVEEALLDATSPIPRAAWTIAARHAGVVLGLLVLTPIFTADLGEQQLAAQRAGSALLLDAPLRPGVKVTLGERLAERVQSADGRLPNLRPAFRGVAPEPEQRLALAQLEEELGEELRKAATQAFSRAFIAAALLALLMLVPLELSRRRRRRR